MTALQKVNLGTAPTGTDGDTVRTANVKANANVDVLNTQATLSSSSPNAVRDLTAADMGKRINFTPTAAASSHFPAANTTGADQIVSVHNLSTAYDVTMAIAAGSGDTSPTIVVVKPGELLTWETDGVSAWRTIGRKKAFDEVVQGKLTVAGAVSVAGSFSGASASYAGNMTVGGNSSVTGNLSVSGKVLNASGVEYLNGAVPQAVIFNDASASNGTGPGTTVTVTMGTFTTQRASSVVSISASATAAASGGVASYNQYLIIDIVNASSVTVLSSPSSSALTNTGSGSATAAPMVAQVAGVLTAVGTYTVRLRWVLGGSAPAAGSNAAMQNKTVSGFII